jgi:hypothetical protein
MGEYLFFLAGWMGWEGKGRRKGASLSVLCVNFCHLKGEKRRLGLFSFSDGAVVREVMDGTTDMFSCMVFSCAKMIASCCGPISAGREREGGRRER